VDKEKAILEALDFVEKAEGYPSYSDLAKHLKGKFVGITDDEILLIIQAAFMRFIA
jgi:hypothetical protein